MFLGNPVLSVSVCVCVGGCCFCFAFKNIILRKSLGFARLPKGPGLQGFHSSVCFPTASLCRHVENRDVDFGRSSITRVTGSCSLSLTPATKILWQFFSMTSMSQKGRLSLAFVSLHTNFPCKVLLQCIGKRDAVEERPREQGPLSHGVWGTHTTDNMGLGVS